MKSIISSHDKEVLRPCTKQSRCNCRDKNEYPLENKCRTI